MQLATTMVLVVIVFFIFPHVLFSVRSVLVQTKNMNPIENHVSVSVVTHKSFHGLSKNGFAICVP